jgi:16S rRNA (cytidine1402-2'-O)-methyltransferase
VCRDRGAHAGGVAVVALRLRGFPAGARRCAARTLVFYEAPHRLRESLDDMVAAFGAARPAAVAREITKKFETVYRGTLGSLAQQAAGDAGMSRGELVLVVQGAERAAEQAEVDAERVLRPLLEELPVAQAAKLAAQITGRTRRELYDLALKLRGPRV